MYSTSLSSTMRPLFPIACQKFQQMQTSVFVILLLPKQSIKLMQWGCVWFIYQPNDRYGLAIKLTHCALGNNFDVSVYSSNKSSNALSFSKLNVASHSSWTKTFWSTLKFFSARTFTLDPFINMSPLSRVAPLCFNKIIVTVLISSSVRNGNVNSFNKAVEVGWPPYFNKIYKHLSLLRTAE